MHTPVAVLLGCPFWSDIGLHPALSTKFQHRQSRCFTYIRSKHARARLPWAAFAVRCFFSNRDSQVFSVTHRVRKRHEVMDSSDVRLWKWLSGDVLAIVTKTVGAQTCAGVKHYCSYRASSYIVDPDPRCPTGPRDIHMYICLHAHLARCNTVGLRRGWLVHFHMLPLSGGSQLGRSREDHAEHPVCTASTVQSLLRRCQQGLRLPVHGGWQVGQGKPSKATGVFFVIHRRSRPFVGKR